MLTLSDGFYYLRLSDTLTGVLTFKPFPFFLIYAVFTSGLMIVSVFLINFTLDNKLRSYLLL